ncbi:MAG: RHS repeat-associated core domain-containing protein [Armatimonadota bacterium]
MVAPRPGNNAPDHQPKTPCAFGRAGVYLGQAVTSTFTTEAFGNTVSQWGSSSNPYRFAGLWGYRDDGDAGLLHVGARYYDPQVGRFISRDAVLVNTRIYTANTSRSTQ